MYIYNTVMRPSSYINFARAMKEENLPLDDTVWFGMYRTFKDINAYTVGMTMCVRDEMGVVGADDPPGMGPPSFTTLPTTFCPREQSSMTLTSLGSPRTRP